MNKFIGTGRATKDVDLRYSQDGKAIARGGIAINRTFKNKDGKYDADFLNFVAFGKTAEFLANYLQKGKMFGIEGRIQTSSYENKEGHKVYTTDVVVDNVEILEWPDKAEQKQEGKGLADEGFQALSDEEMDDVPF